MINRVYVSLLLLATRVLQAVLTRVDVIFTMHAYVAVL